MDKMHPGLWQYTANNSPNPLPRTPFVCTDKELFPLEFELMATEPVTLEVLLQKLSQATVDESTLEEFFTARSAPSMAERKPMLLLGELANPFQLSRLRLGIVPVINVRLGNLCRTYADSLDSRMINPGVHHVTLARTAGWWESTHMAFVTTGQMKSMVEWLNGGKRGHWRPVRPREGIVKVENSTVLCPPPEAVTWDGVTETCIAAEPDCSGPQFDISDVTVPIHVRHGCYDNRGKIVRCAHVGQREFHANYFRRGSSKQWQDILDIV